MFCGLGEYPFGGLGFDSARDCPAKALGLGIGLGVKFEYFLERSGFGSECNFLVEGSGNQITRLGIRVWGLG